MHCWPRVSFQSTAGQPLVSHWSAIGQSLVNPWSAIGQPLVSHWSILGQPLVSHWSAIGQPLVSHWSILGQPLVNPWSILGQPLVSPWSIFGQPLVNLWPVLGQPLVNPWSILRQPLVNHWSVLVQSLVPLWSLLGQPLTNQDPTVPAGLSGTFCLTLHPRSPSAPCWPLSAQSRAQAPHSSGPAACRTAHGGPWGPSCPTALHHRGKVAPVRPGPRLAAGKGKPCSVLKKGRRGGEGERGKGGKEIILKYNFKKTMKNNTIKAWVGSSCPAALGDSIRRGDKREVKFSPLPQSQSTPIAISRTFPSPFHPPVAPHPRCLTP